MHTKSIKTALAKIIIFWPNAMTPMKKYYGLDGKSFWVIYLLKYPESIFQDLN